MKSNLDVLADVELANHVTILPDILEIICHTTDMGFAVVAKVTPEKWIACQVLDTIQFGLLPGGELKVDTTICHEIRQSSIEVVIDHVATDAVYYQHHTPAMYGFQSYISVPVTKQNGDFFGTLCAIDPRPALLNTPEIIDMFKTYAQLISLHLDIAENDPDAQKMEHLTRDVLKQELLFLSENGPTSDDRARRNGYYKSSVSQSTIRIKKLIERLKK